jgi:hypothetical protein
VDWLAFIASLVGSLAWPAVILIVALVFRKTLRAALARPLKRVKAGPFEAEWDDKVARAFVDLAESPESSEAPPAADKPVSSRLQSVARQSPRAAVMAASAEIEEALRRRLAVRGLAEAERRPMSARQLSVLAEEHELISPQTADAIRGATVLRNLAAHGPENEIDEQKAVEFLALADAILFALKTGVGHGRPSAG